MNAIKTVALLGALTGLLVFLGNAIGGSGGALLGLIMAAVMNFGSWFFSDKMALAAYQAQPVSPAEAPQLHAIVERLAQRAQIPTPALYIIPSEAANAFATGRDPEHAAVAVTEGIMRILPQDELEGVLAHELTHILNRDTLTQAVAATIAGGISYIAQMASYGLWFSGGDDRRENSNPLGGLLAIFLAPMAATVIQLAISRTREFGADAGAADLTGNPGALARALQRLESGAETLPLDGNPAYQPLLIMNTPARNILANLFSTHPSTQKRIDRLMALANLELKNPVLPV
jgi:heat shock protein HtpX